jgi:hypothetical protein
VQSNLKFKLWLAIAILVAILFSCAGFKLAFHSPYTIQDDARQHVFWMQRFNDPDLFKGDLIADYFSSVAPLGYRTLYRVVNSFGVEPFLFNKILPGILGVVTTAYLFLIILKILYVPFAGFVGTLLLNQNLWMLDDLVSGTPRAFFYPLCLGFIYYLLRRSLIPCVIFIILQGLFYPQVVLISAVILIINFLRDRKDRKFYLFNLVIAVGILGFYALQTSEFSQVISLQQAKELPEFYTGGRNEFFVDNASAFWLSAQRSGFFPREWQYVLLCSFGLCLPILKRYPRRFPLINNIHPDIKILWQILLASVVMFVLAHLFLFKLHLPSRYSQHTLRILIAIVDGMAIAILLNGITRNIKAFAAIIMIGALLYPTYAVQSYPYRLGYVTGKATELYQFLQQQPKDVLIASLSKEADFILSLAQRSVLVAEEYSIPYHLDYYQQVRQRTKDLIQAQYSYDSEIIINFINKYGVDFWLLDKNAFTVEYLNENSWLKQFESEINDAIANIQSDQDIILSSISRDCQLLNQPDYLLLKSDCIVRNIN